MKVGDVMSQPVFTCGPDTSIAEAARVMRDADCGILPVVDSNGSVVGVITDRDVCLAVAANNPSSRTITVREVMTNKVITTRMVDEVDEALATMKRGRVRRLPVLDGEGRLLGLLSLEDVVVRGVESGAVIGDEIVRVLRGIYERRPVLMPPGP